MEEFIGAGHRDVLDLLHGRLCAITAGDASVPRVVVFRGASGVGKSRTLRELYRELRVRRDDTYWPPIEESGAGNEQSRDPLPGRKAIGPSFASFIWPAGSLPTFGWWQFHCERMQSGDVIDVVAQARNELEAHLVPLVMAWSAVATRRQKIGKQKDTAAEAARDALKEGGLEAAAQALAHFDIALPGLGSGLSWLARGAGAVSRARQRRELRDTDVSLDAGMDVKRRSAAEELAELIAEVSHPMLPGVVVIEDLHLMDTGMPALLNALATPRSGRPILVVGTAWPENDNAGAYGQWRAKAIDAGVLEIVRMPDLGRDDLVHVVRSFAPNTDDYVAGAVVDLLPNPLALEALLSSSRVERAVRANGGALPEDAVGAVPASVEEVYRARFRELEAVTRTGLALCAGALPDTDTATVWPFLRSMVIEAVSGNDSTRNFVGDALAGSDHAVQQGVWLTTDGIADSFREALQAGIASDYLHEELLLPAAHRSYRASVEAALRRWIDSQRGEGYRLPDTDEALVFARWYRELASEATNPAFVAASLLVARRLADTYQYRAAVAVMEPIMPELDSDHPDTLTTRNYLASWLGESGRVGEAVEQLSALLADWVRVLGADHPNTLTTRSHLAFWSGRVGQVGEAVEQFTVLLADRVRVLGADHPDTLTTRNYLASCLGGAGRVGEAVEQLTVLLADRVRVLGADHPDTLATRGNLALQLGRSGRVGEAVEQLAVLLDEQVGVLGVDHPDTLITRGNLALQLGRSGRVGEAVEQFTVLLADRVRVLGADHPNTLITRGNLASWLGESGRVGEAVEQFTVLLADRVRVLGADHPDTLATRGNLASWLGESGRVGEAVEQLAVLLDEQVGVLGVDHPDTLITRGNLASWLGKSGRVSEAVEQFAALLDEEVRALGTEHPNTLATRSNLAWCLGRSGRVGEAVEQFAALLDEQVRVLGVDHPDTLAARSNLAFWLGKSGRVGEAVEQFAALLDELVRVLGADHPNTLGTRSNLAFWLGKSGRVGEAVEQFAALLTDCLRVLGPDHPTTQGVQSLIDRLRRSQ